MASASTKLGHGLAKVLRIKLDYRDETAKGAVSRGESVFSVSSADSYIEEEPTSMEWIMEHAPTGQNVVDYLLSLLPFLSWIHRYNLQWFIGDLVAGVTIGAVVVPQSMAYAKLAELPVEFGLYSAFMGVLIYWFFGTSKDITIGPVAVMSTVVGNVITSTQDSLPQYQPYQIAEAMAIIGGSILAFMGFARIGFIVDFISLTAISAFITGAAISIGVGQVPNLMGISGVNTHGAAYETVIGVLKHLGRTQLDAAIGLTALFLLYLYRFVCTQMAKRFPQRAKLYFFISTLRTVFVILLYTLISWLANKGVAGANYKDAHFKILGHVPRGFQDAGVPVVNKTLIKAFASQLPATVIVLLIEHIAISKSFGRINNYTINPSQELLAIGITNLLGPFLGAYPATGSFSRTAIKSKAGVRTPFAGVITAIVVLLAIYALPAVFYWIPQAGLAAVIIHAVGDLITPPNTVYQFWRISPLEVIIFFAGVIVTVFSSIENGIYVTVSVSAALLLWRVAKARGRFLGKVKVHSVIGDHLLETNEKEKAQGLELRQAPLSSGEDNTTAARNVFLPIDHGDGSNPSLALSSPHPGVFIYRFSEGFNYPNANHYLDHFVQTIFKQTRRTSPHSYAKPGDRPWNNPGPRKGQEEIIDYKKPTLKAVILDFSSVNNVDVTSVQNLIDVRNQLDKYAAPDTVEWHFAYINNRWTKRALVSAGFGFSTPEDAAGEFHRWKPIFSVAELGGGESAAEAAELRDNLQRARGHDVEASVRPKSGGSDSGNPKEVEHGITEYHDPKSEFSETKPAPEYKMSRVAVVQGLNRPLFHIDLTSALQSAVRSIESKQGQ